MLSGTLRQIIPFILFFGFVKVALAQTLPEIDESFNNSDELYIPDSMLFGEETMVAPEEEVPAFEEVSQKGMSPKEWQNASKIRSGSGMVPIQARVNIKDETATTGDNAQRRLPNSFQRLEETHPLYWQKVDQVIPNLTLIDFNK
ncbi:MAG: hypothetical protein FJX71_01240 [Alphaproteobacteria bacterium]|nr:hypothetical protein [Alphaproteobacteria bacterium]